LVRRYPATHREIVEEAPEEPVEVEMTREEICHFRATLLAVNHVVAKASSVRSKDKLKGQATMFGDMGVEATVTLPQGPVEPLGWAEVLEGEYKALGIYLRGHPLEDYEDTFDEFASHSASRIDGLPDKEYVALIGLTRGVSAKNLKNKGPGEPARMGRFFLEDRSGSVECICWPETFLSVEPVVGEGSLVYVTGKVDRRRSPAQVVVDHAEPLPEFAAKPYPKGAWHVGW
jgi:DNA polymerase III subunit alpha